MSIFEQMAIRIIQEQALVIGPLAWLEAGKVQGLKVINPDKGEIDMGDDKKSVVDGLVNRYENIFGRASREVCKEAAATLVAELPESDVPASLR